MAKIWGIQPWAGKSIAEDKTVMDQYNAEAKPEDKVKAQAESQALEGTSFILDDYIGPGAFAKVGATLKAAAGALAGKAMLVGAFRSSNDSMLSRKVIEGLDSMTGFAKKPGAIEQARNEGREAFLDTIVFNKLSTKELSKYGTPEFALDKWLRSTNTDPLGPLRTLQEITPKTIGKTAEAGLVRNGNQDLIYARDTIQSYIDRGIEVPASLLREEEQAKNAILRHGRVFEDLNLAEKTGKTLLHSRSNSYIVDDITEGAWALQRSIERHDLPLEDLANKSLQQITALVNKKDEESVRILRKSMDAKNKVIQAKTAELAQSSPQPVEGFVQLMEPIDLAHETASLNHCLGAVGRDNDVYTPAFDVITGKAHPNQASTNTSYAGYVERMADGRSEFYSYRPKGTPEFTIEVVNNGKGRYITQAYGKEDRVLTDAEENLVKEFADKKGIDYPDWKGHYANYEFDQLLQPAIAPDNAIGQNANDQNFWNFLQQQN